jgi:protocatechuate 3,4-dioxygenase beta subunit
MKNSRREFLGAAGALAALPLLGAQDASKTLAPTEANIQGPYYRKNAPFRSKLAEGVKGDALVISGRILSPDGAPLRDAIVDVWHASAEGEYDNDSAKFLLRGRLRSDKDGLYRYETIMPGQYDLGEAKRPAHIHYKVSADAHRPLTTQLYFKGDKWLERDPFVLKSLIIPVEKAAGTFDIVLPKA